MGPAGVSAYNDLWEDFETSVIPNPPWTTASSIPWQVATDRIRFGARAAANGPTSHLQTSSITLPLNLSRASLVSFHYSVSSEAGFDWIKWELDGRVVDGLSGVGSSTSWFQSTFSVPPGNHTIRWLYTKDGSISSGQDKAWLDGVLVTNYSRSSSAYFVQPPLPEGFVLWSQRDESAAK